MLEVVNKTLTQAHYTEEDLKNLETLASPRAPSGNRDYLAGAGTTSPHAGAGTTSQAAIAIQNTRQMNKVQHSLD